MSATTLGPVCDQDWPLNIKRPTFTICYLYLNLMHIVAQNIADVNAKIEILIKHLLSTNVWNSRNEGTTNGSMSIFFQWCAC